MTDWRADRRRMLQLLATTGLTASLAGCSDDGADDDTTEGGTTIDDTDGTGPGDSDESLPSGFETLWETELQPDGTGGEGVLTAVDSDFLAVSIGHTVYGIDTANETLAWEFSEGGDVKALAVSDSHVFLHHDGSAGGQVYSVGQATGEVEGQRGGTEDDLPMAALSDYVVVPYEYQGFNDRGV